MNLAVDENLPPWLADACHALLSCQGGNAISIPKTFGRGISDVDWIAELRKAAEPWCILTLDRKLRTRPHERKALEQSGCVFFILAADWAPLTYWPKVTGIIQWLPQMIDAAAEYGGAEPAGNPPSQTGQNPALYEIA